MADVNLSRADDLVFNAGPLFGDLPGNFDDCTGYFDDPTLVQIASLLVAPGTNSADSLVIAVGDSVTPTILVGIGVVDTLLPAAADRVFSLLKFIDQDFGSTYTFTSLRP